MKRLLAITACVVLACVTVALAQYNTSNYREQGGARWVVGGSCDVASGGDLDIESGGAIKIAGTTITSTAAELNVLDGVTATYAEINLLDGSVAGTSVASKVLTLGATKNTDSLDVGYINITVAKLYIGAVAVTSTAAELNKLDAVTAGTTSASLALVVGTGKDLDSLRLDGLINDKPLDYGPYVGEQVVAAVLGTIAVAGVTATDVAFATNQDSLGAVRAWCGTDTVFVAKDGPTSHTLSYQVFRP